MAILGGAQDRDFAQLRIDRGLREQRITQTAPMKENALRIGGHFLHIEYDASGLENLEHLGRGILFIEVG